MDQKQQIGTSHLTTQLPAYDVLTVLGFTQPKSGSTSGYYSEVSELAEKIKTGFHLSSEQLGQLRAVRPSRNAMTNQVSPQIRETWTTAMFLLGAAPQFADQATIRKVCDMAIAAGQTICEEYGISLQAAVAGLREASQLVSSTH